ESSFGPERTWVRAEPVPGREPPANARPSATRTKQEGARDDDRPSERDLEVSRQVDGRRASRGERHRFARASRRSRLRSARRGGRRDPRREEDRTAAPLPRPLPPRAGPRRGPARGDRARRRLRDLELGCRRPRPPLRGPRPSRDALAAPPEGRSRALPAPAPRKRGRREGAALDLRPDRGRAVA